MPLPSSGIIVVEKPSSATITRINNPASSSNRINSSNHPPQDQAEQQSQIQYIEYYDVVENQHTQRHQQQQQSTIVVDATLFHQQQQQQQLQLGGSSSVAIGRKVLTSSASLLSSSSLSPSSSPLCATSSTLLNKQNFQIQTLKTVPMPQNKYSQQQIIQHTSHSTNSTATISNPQHHLHQQTQHVQQINLAASSIHPQTHQHHSQQQATPTTHMIQVSNEFLEQAANSHNTGSMMISTTGEVINQQQIFKIVSTDGTTGNMIIDATNQNANSSTTSKVLLSNLTVLSKQPSNSQAQIITNNHQQAQSVGQTINFVNAKNLYTTSTAGGSIISGSKQQKFAVTTTNVGNYKSSSMKQSSSGNSQYLQQASATGQQKINLTAGNRNVQMLTTNRVQNPNSNNATSNIASNNNITVISNNAAPAQTMVLQQPQKFITSSAAGSKMTTAALGSSSGGNVVKKSTTTGTLRMNNSHNTSTATKLMNNLQTTPGVKTFITQSPSIQSHPHQNLSQLTTLQHHTNKSGSKSKFVKQYNNAIINSAGAVAIATLPHQQSNSQNNVQVQQQQQQHHHQQLQPQTTYINHHKNSGGSTKINKINSKYASVNLATQLPPGTQLHQKSIIQQSQQPQQQFQTTNSNSNIKFVNAQGTVIQQQHQQSHQQQVLTPQKVNTKNHHHHHIHQQQQYQNVHNFDTVDGNNVYHNANTNQSNVGVTSTLAVSSGTASLPLSATSGSTLLTDDIMMVNGTQMTDELSARILQSMSQKSFNNQRYHQQQQHVYQTKNSSAPTPASTNSNNHNSSSSNMLPPPSCSSQNTIVQTNNSTNILLSPREYTLYPTTTSSSAVSIASANQQVQQQQQLSTPIPYNNSTNPTAAASSNITAGSLLSSNYVSVSNNNNMAPIVTHSSGNSTTNNVSTSASSVRQAQSAPGSRSQSMERKLHESSMSRKSSEYYKVNNHNSMRGSGPHNNIANSAATPTQPSGNFALTTGNMSASVSNLLGAVSSTTSHASTLPVSRLPSLPPSALIMEPQAQVIHLQATKSLPGANNSSNDDDDDIIGEEVRPAPVETQDVRLRILHAVLFDHTYVNPMPSELPTSFAVQLPSTSKSNCATSITSTTSGLSQQWSLGGIGAITAAGSGNISQQSYALYGSQLSRLHKDIDSYSPLNNNSGLTVGDIDPGEETETAPEAELEDDSITRCICDLTHDDGYMICCDKCCAWQHVDCMGIDRQNIPDEYLCELCQPRIVDKVRARSLQLMKRKEQQQQLMMSTQAQASGSANTIGAAGSAGGSSTGSAGNLLNNDLLGAQQRLSSPNTAGFNLTGSMSGDPSALKLLAGGGSNMKKNKLLKKAKDGVSGKRTKKAEKLGAAAGLATNNKPGRKETKKNTKRKKTGAHDGNNSTVGMTAAEKYAANLRQWIENYELAVTNHYSPELRARLHAISKQPSLLQSILNTENPILKEFSNGSLENRATTVPHAGGKILISNLDIVPNSPICELRGKYMLTTQYKTQNTSMNMNSPPPSNYHLASYKAHKTPGPFIFFYQLPGTEVASSNQLVSQTTTTTTLNPDGTYTTTLTTLPAQQSPPTFLKGPEICVDTRTYGNEARFVRRSCRPNAEIQHLFEKGTIHLFIVALTDIRASTEITIRHEPHDLLAIDNKKTSAIIIQPTSTPCACGLTKDCIFGPPLPLLPSSAKSNAGRKSLVHSGGIAGNTGNLTAKQRKTNQQNINRNRSISSSASGDSNMGVTVAANAIGMNLNSPNNVCKMQTANKLSNNNTLMPLTASCNSNLSNASSSSSTLASIMHDSGVCTSSSSPSVSLPSPTQHMHSPIQQQQQSHSTHQQQTAQQIMHNNQIKPTVQLLPQQQQQQIMQTLPTPLVLPSRSLSYQQQQSQQNPAIILQQQSINVISSQPVTTIRNCGRDGNIETEQKPSFSVTENTCQLQNENPSINQQITLNEPQIKTNSIQPPPTVLNVSSGLLETVSPEATIAAVALQSLNSSHSPNTSIAAPSFPVSGNVETQLQSPQTQQNQFIIVPVKETENEKQPAVSQQTTHQTPDNKIENSSVVSINSSPQQQQQQSPQQYKSPQKSTYSQNSSAHPARKTPGKQHARTTSFSEENDQHSEDNSLTSTPTSSTPKEKPKLSREDRKMEAILRAIEKMERNQQKQKQAKRQNSSGSQNTTPTSPNKSLESSESSTTTKRSNTHVGTAGRSKKKRKAGTKGAHSGGNNNQRKRRQSRANSQESADECNHQNHEMIASESDGSAMLHSPPIQTNASPNQLQLSVSSSSSTTGSITTSIAHETANNVDQAAGLLMAFANPEISPMKSNSTSDLNVRQMQQSPQRSASQYVIPSMELTSSSPPTPPSQVSSACLLIEAAVGPLESNLDTSNTEIHNTEFKYPLQAKTKKHLMNNWLHQTEDLTSDKTNSMAEATPHSLQTTTPNPSVVHGGALENSIVSGGLDSLLQAAMCDLTQSQSDQEQPQNLSIAAQKVEEFIQQSEASGCNSQLQTDTKHSFAYEQHHQHPLQRAFANLPTPAVDLTLKTPLTVGPPNVFTSESNSSQNLQLPLQVSTCSNNSSVKKRWLRQAISEETHEEYSMTPSPANAPLVNSLSSSQPQQASGPVVPTAATSNFVPNGFTTPLKKRRLLLTGKDDVDENINQSSGELCAFLTPSSPSTLQTVQQQHPIEGQVATFSNNESVAQELPKDNAQDLSTREMPEDADVDVEKYEIYRPQMPENQPSVVLKAELRENSNYCKTESDQGEYVDVTSSLAESLPSIKPEIVVKHENDVALAETKEECFETSTQQMEQRAQPVEFNDQDDDVDILRSPSPGREMIKAEDNLVKIEPEDTSGMEDVKIDVEREESMAADDIIVAEHKENKEEIKSDSFKKHVQNNADASTIDQVEIKKEYKLDKEIEDVQTIPKTDETNVENKADGKNKETKYESQDETEEPKPKRVKLEEAEAENPSLIFSKKEVKDVETPKAEEVTKKTEQPKQLVHYSNKNDEKVKTEAVKREKRASDESEVTSSDSSSLLAIKTVAADSTFADLEASTPPTTQTSIVSSITAAPIQRNKSLSDDDIQARLHSFHKENILILQSRNKKTKTSSVPSSSATNIMCNNNEQNKSRTSVSSSSSTSYHQHQHHHNHHHHHHNHDGKVKIEKSSSKHHKSSTTSQQPSSTKKTKLHKRERTTSASSSNSHKNSTIPQMPSSSSSSNKNISNSSTSISSSGSTKKLKSLKKSSSSSSTSSGASLSTATSTPQNSLASSSTTINAATSSEKDRDKHNKQKITSTSVGNNSNSAGNNHTSHTQNYPTSKKRQLNFELELTKDMHLLNSVMTSGKKKDTKLFTDDQGHVTAKKSKKESSLLQKEDLRSGSSKSIKTEKQQERKTSVTTIANTSTKQIATFSTTSHQPVTTFAINTASLATPTDPLPEESKVITTIVSQSPQSSLATTSVLREHPTLPHFNNVVGSTAISFHQQLQTSQPPFTPVQSQPNASITPPYIPNLASSPSFIPSVHGNSNHQTQIQQASLPPTPPPPAASASSPSPSQTVNSTSNLPFYNTIYGKLLDNSTPSSCLPLAATSSNSTGPHTAATNVAVVPTAGNGVLSEYVDTKLKSYNTLGGYVSHTALFGLSNITSTKDPIHQSAGVSPPTTSVGSTISHGKDSSAIEMPAPLATISSNSIITTASGNNASTVMPLKIHTKTASHDPRLNPQLTAPEPPPQPKRKLSINEYRKRMQQSSSNESNCGGGSLTTTPTTPPSTLESPLLLGTITNKCTLYSPDRLTQSVDSQIQKEIMSTSSAVASSSSDSLNSSNSSTSLNDTLLKSSSFVEEDSTKGQFNAAPTLLEKQQESLCARLKSLKEKQSLGASFSVGSGNRSRFSSFSESVASSDFNLRKDEDEIEILRNRNLSISSSLGGGDLLDNCLEEISSTSTSMSSSRESSPGRSYNTHRHKALTSSGTTNSSTISHSNNGQTARYHQQQQHHQHHQQPKHNINCDKNELTCQERKRSVDIA